MQAAFLFVWGLELFLAGGKQAAADHYSIMQVYPPGNDDTLSQIILP